MADPQVVAAMQGLVRDLTEMSDFTDDAHAITGDPASAPPPTPVFVDAVGPTLRAFA